jgi:hypothetical protein
VKRGVTKRKNIQVNLEVITMETPKDLNELLEKAHSAQAFWDEWEKAGEYDRDEFWKKLHRAKGDAWNNLYKAMQTAVPLTVKSKSGEYTIGTVGALTSTEMMYYSTTAGAKWTMQGICLRSLISIEPQ